MKIGTYYSVTIFFAILFSSVSVAFAAPRTFEALVSQFVGYLNAGTVVLLSLAILFFFWSIAKNLFSIGGEKSEEQAKKLKESITWGIIIIFVMVSLWGIIAILQTTLLNGL